MRPVSCKVALEGRDLSVETTGAGKEVMTTECNQAGHRQLEAAETLP